MRRLGRRLGRMRQVRSAGTSARDIAELAVEYGLDPEELRAELMRHQAQIRRSGREPVDILISRLASEYGLAETEVWADYERICARLGYPP